MSALHAGVTRAPFGTMPVGRPVELFTLANANGVEVRAITYGGVIVSLRVPDRDGRLGDVVLGYDDLAGYLADTAFLGALIGRYGNRIAQGRFTLDGREIQLDINDGPHHLHGGRGGFHTVAWDASPFEAPGAVGIVLRHTSPDGDQGYPGSLDARVTYTLSDDNSLMVEYEATTDRPTIVNLTQHSYFDLSAGAAENVLGHELTLHADHFTPVDGTLIPTGELAPVEGTPFDFRTPTPIGARIEAPDAQLGRGHGYDHNFVLRGSPTGGAGDAPLAHAARVVEPTTGRVLDVHTSEPGVQLYTANFLDGSVRGKASRPLVRHAGFCLETQHFPDTPNHPAFPPVTLRPGETYRSRTVFSFSTDRG